MIRRDPVLLILLDWAGDGLSRAGAWLSWAGAWLSRSAILHSDRWRRARAIREVEADPWGPAADGTYQVLLAELHQGHAMGCRCEACGAMNSLIAARIITVQQAHAAVDLTGDAAPR
jgi:hypothetical protein